MRNTLKAHKIGSQQESRVPLMMPDDQPVFARMHVRAGSSAIICRPQRRHARLQLAFEGSTAGG
jgi:hypothetical protein